MVYTTWHFNNFLLRQTTTCLFFSTEKTTWIGIEIDVGVAMILIIIFTVVLMMDG